MSVSVSVTVAVSMSMSLYINENGGVGHFMMDTKLHFSLISHI